MSEQACTCFGLRELGCLDCGHVASHHGDGYSCFRFRPFNYANADFKLTHAEFEEEAALRGYVEVPVDSRLEEYVQLAETHREIILGLESDLARATANLNALRRDVLRAWRASK